ncbi:MAG TPA: NUDIX domain-containing protein [Brumimicrobium sp.]|nr:NUDIX domain-containing protein [Brumimicrobium sp.]
MKFNIRVYGILIHEEKVLLSDERFRGREFTKFPGGGLEFGEGIKDCLKRELKEELNIDVQVGELLYLTDFFVTSAFNKEDQIISVYYYVNSQEIDKIKVSDIPLNFQNEEHKTEVYRWKNVSELTKEDMTFPIDKLVVDRIKED